MTTVHWDPTQYLHYRDERIRPFIELVGRVHAPEVAEVLDLGCGPGNATALLLERWPEARVLGVDNSAEMMSQAAPLVRPGKLEFELGEIMTWEAPRHFDVIVSNAAFQWVRGHTSRFSYLLSILSPGGWFAFQVPNMSEAPSHKLLEEIALSARWRDQLASHVRALNIDTTEEYLLALEAAGCDVDAWETTYFQILPGEDAVLEWVRGSSMRPFLAALSPEDAIQFQDEYRTRAAALYPRRDLGTIYPFRRTFVVAHRRDH